jgi:hypothetical protein
MFIKQYDYYAVLKTTNLAMVFLYAPQHFRFTEYNPVVAHRLAITLSGGKTVRSKDRPADQRWWIVVELLIL